MKKLLFVAYSLEIGGIENALVTLVNYLAQNREYDITLVLEKKKGILLKEIDRKIKIIEYTPNASKNIIVRKLCNIWKRIVFKAFYYHQFETAVSYATYSLPASFIARTASKNRILWVHTDYYQLFEGDIQKVKEFFSRVQYSKFAKIVFVSEEARTKFIAIFPEQTNKAVVCKNLIDDQKIVKLAKEEVEFTKKEELTTFLHVGRHTEEDKKLTRLIEVAVMLKKDNLAFQILLVGDGKDHKLYQELVKEKDLQETICFLGEKKNPYPYFMLSDALILTSEYEGFPVVYIEAMLLNLPIITTEVSDSKKIVENEYGIVSRKEVRDIYDCMKKFINEGYAIKEKFNPKEYNEEIVTLLDNLF